MLRGDCSCSTKADSHHEGAYYQHTKETDHEEKYSHEEEYNYNYKENHHQEKQHTSSYC